MLPNTDKVNRMLTPSTLTLNYKGRTKLFTSDKPEYKRVVELLKNPDEVSRESSIVDFFEGLLVKPTTEPTKEDKDYKIDGNKVSIRNAEGKFVEVPRVLGDRVRSFAAEGLPYQPLLNFWNRVCNNTSNGSVERLYSHLERHHHPILEDGRFLAYKRVTEDFKDFWTRTFDNSIGAKPFIERREVDDDPRKECSFGLNIASFSYAMYRYQGGVGNGHLIELAVDPADVVTVTFDENLEKMRVTTYEVLSVCHEEHRENLTNHVGSFAEDPDISNTCPDCRNLFDFCECSSDEENDDWDEDLETCEDCELPIDDCECDWNDEDE